MNDELPILNSTEKLSNRFSDYANVYWLPLICLFGIITNLLNIFVFSQKKLRSNELLRNYFAISISDFCFLLIEFPIFAFRCGYLCSYSYGYILKLYELYVYLFVGYICTVFGVLIDITLAYTRLLLFTTTSKTSWRFNLSLKTKCALCMLISIILNVPENGVSKEIAPFAKIPNNDGQYRILYHTELRENMKSFQTLNIVLIIIKGPATFLILAILNSLVLFKFTRHLSKRMVLKNTGARVGFKLAQTSQTKENKMTLMIILMCLIYIVGNTMDTIELCLFLVGVDMYGKFDFVVIIGNTFLFASHGCNIFILYTYNQTYRRTFNRLLNRFISLKIFKLAYYMHIFHVMKHFFTTCKCDRHNKYSEDEHPVTTPRNHSASASNQTNHTTSGNNNNNNVQLTTPDLDEVRQSEYGTFNATVDINNSDLDESKIENTLSNIQKTTDGSRRSRI